MPSGTMATYSLCCFFFNDTATTEIYTLSLHDALPISGVENRICPVATSMADAWAISSFDTNSVRPSGLTTTSRSEEHTSELQSRLHLVCRLLLEKKKKTWCAQTGARLSFNGMRLYS